MAAVLLSRDQKARRRKAGPHHVLKSEIHVHVGVPRYMYLGTATSLSPLKTRDIGRNPLKL